MYLHSYGLTSGVVLAVSRSEWKQKAQSDQLSILPYPPPSNAPAAPPPLIPSEGGDKVSVKFVMEQKWWSLLD